MSFAKLQQEDRRLVILMLLSKSGGYGANEFLLRSGLAGSGHAIGRDLLRTELSWLTEQGLIDVSDIDGTVIAKLSARGADVACGVVVVPGVKRPEPEL